jgi:voltage-gated potassium channel
MNSKPKPLYMTPSLERWREKTDTALTVLATASLPLVLVELKRESLTRFDQRFLEAVNIVLLVAFVVDYFAELWCASNRGRYVRHEWGGALLMVAQIIAVLPALGGFGLLRLLRSVRLLRPILVVVRAFVIGGNAAKQGRASLRKNATRFAAGIAGFTWLTSAVGFTLVEDVRDGGRVSSFFDALWWSTETITTVGYGDVFPVTFAGRCIAAVTMVVGISTFAIVTAKVAEFFLRSDAIEPEPT